MPNVLRVVQANGKGMYRKGFADRIGLNIYETGTHPMPFNDSLFAANAKRMCIYADDIRDYRFAFADDNQLRRWLYHDQWLQDMHEHGAVCKVYYVPESQIVIGTTQCMFRMKSAKLLEVKSLLTFL